MQNIKKDIPCHQKELTRLKKISGQISGIQRMIDEKRYCIDILQQLSAAKSAINSLQANILETHISHCVKESFKLKSEEEIEQKAAELKEIFKKY